MGVILWIVRALAVLLLVRFVLRLLFGRRGVPSQPNRPQGTPERLGGELVRDPHCGTYVAKARAIVVGSGASATYFCSETCRDAYAASHVSA